MRDITFLNQLREPATWIELRLDRYDDVTLADVQGVLQRYGPQCVVTCRRVDEGGGQRFQRFNEADRIRFWRTAWASQAAFVDVELATLCEQPDLAASLRASGASVSQLLISSHDFQGVPDAAELRRRRLQAEMLGADLVKLVVNPADLIDSLPLLDCLLDAGDGHRPLLGIAMGEAGLWTRVLAQRFISPPPFTFVRASDAPGTAAGQPSVDEMRHLYRFREMRADWPVYGVIGNPIAHSLSPHVHNHALAQCNLPGVYLPLLLVGDPVAFVTKMAPRLGLRGLSVTLPHKETVRAACRELTPLAARIKAVNTLLAPDAHGTWKGENTDATASVACLEKALGGVGKLVGKTVLILGAGGAARAVAYGVHRGGGNVLIANRNRARASLLAQAVGGDAVAFDDVASLAHNVDAVVNTTPVGMHPNIHASPLADAEIPPNKVVFDTIYNPSHTLLLKRAASRGCITVSGEAMFISQAAAQFELFTGVPAPLDAMRQIVTSLLLRGDVS